MTQIQIDGQRFEVNTEWAVQSIFVSFAAVVGGPEVSALVVYDPDSVPGASNAGNGITVEAWTDTAIDFSFSNHPNQFVREVVAFSAGNANSLTFGLAPDQPTSSSNDFTVAYNAGTDTLTFSSPDGNFSDFAANIGGTTCAIMDLSGTHSVSGPWNVPGLNPWDATTVSSTEITLANAAAYFEPSFGPGLLTIEAANVYDAVCAPGFIEFSWIGSVGPITLT